MRIQGTRHSVRYTRESIKRGGSLYWNLMYFHVVWVWSQVFLRRLTSEGIFNNRPLFKNNTLLFSHCCRRLTSEGIFNNRPLFKNNTLLFSHCFLEILEEEDKAVMEGDKVVLGKTTRENPGSCDAENITMYFQKLIKLLTQLVHPN